MNQHSSYNFGSPHFGKVKKVKGKVIPVQGCERFRLPHFLTFASHMAVRLSALRAGRSLPPGRFLVLIFVRG
jgi:hypothetical protein